jgi:hypothetical protein
LFLLLLSLVLLHASIREEFVWRSVSAIGAIIF